MAWGLKVALFIFALVAIGFGAWIIAVLIFAYLFLPSVFRKKRRESGKSFGIQSNKSRSIGTGKIIGGLFLVLGLVALLSGGILSPIVLTLTGITLLFWSQVASRLPVLVRPAEDSVLMRGRLLPFEWFAFAEAKISTRDPEGALSGVAERIILVSTPAPRIMLVFSTSSLTRIGAEQTLLQRMQSAARSLGPLGVYLLPLDGKAAFEVSTMEVERFEIPNNDLGIFLRSADISCLVAEARNGFVNKCDVFRRRTGQRGNSASLLTVPKFHPRSQIMLCELLHEMRQRAGFPQPDGYVTFLSSMAATRGESIGQRIAQVVQGPQTQLLLVSSLSGPQVEMSRAQLRAVSTVYE